MLGADVYVPRGAGPVPAIAIRHPYGRRTPEMGMAEVGSFFARKGYACVVQDVRGKFSSGGAFDPGVGEVEDGYDTVDWSRERRLVQRPCRAVGRVVLRLHVAGRPRSAGTRRWPASRPATSAPTGAASGTGGGALQLNTAGYWAIAMDDAGVRRPDAGRRLAPAAGRHGRGGRRRRRLLPRPPSTAPSDDAWWRERSLRHLLADVRVPVLTWSGWYDNFTGEQLHDLQLIRADPPARPRPCT